MIQEAAENLKDKLPQRPDHPRGRNSFAHIPKVIISLLGESYTKLPDDRFDDVTAIIKFCEENPF